MALTEAEKVLLKYLKLYGVTLTNCVIILTELRDEEQQLQLLEWMANNPEATEGAIIAMAKRIAG